MNSEKTRQNRPAVHFSLLVVRVVAGVIFAAHGAQKLFGAFEGPGMEKTVEMMGQIGYLVAIAEFFGGLGLVVGLFTRFSAASLIGVMVGAIWMVHGKNGFFLSNGGYEYNLALIGLLFPILVVGAGRYAVGHLLPFPKSARTGRTVAILE